MRLLLLLLLLLGRVSASTPKGIELVGTSPANPQGRVCAVLVGISDFADAAIPDLRYGAADAQLFAATLTDRAGVPVRPFAPGEDCFRGAKRGGWSLTGAAATRSQVRLAVEAALGQAGPEDTVILYFSTHGEIVGDDVVLVTQDSTADDRLANTGVSLDRVRLEIKESRARNVIWFVDACHAGVERSSAAGAQLLEGRSGHRSELMLASSLPRESSLEDAAWCGGHGAFTCALSVAFAGAADVDRNGVVDLGELAAEVPGLVRTLTGARQTPRYGGDFESALVLGARDPGWSPPAWVLGARAPLPDPCVGVGDRESARGCYAELIAEGLAVQVRQRPDLLVVSEGTSGVYVAGVEVTTSAPQAAWQPCLEALRSDIRREVGGGPPGDWRVPPGARSPVTVDVRGADRLAYTQPILRVHLEPDAEGDLRAVLSSTPARAGRGGVLEPVPGGSFRATGSLLDRDIHLSEMCEGVPRPASYQPALTGLDSAAFEVKISAEAGCYQEGSLVRAGRPREILSELHGGDRLCFVVTAAQPGHVYLVNLGTSGKISAMFPWPADKPNALSPGVPLRMGPFLVQGPTGEERFKLVISPVPLPGLLAPPGSRELGGGAVEVFGRGVVTRDVVPEDPAGGDPTLGRWSGGISVAASLEQLGEGRFIVKDFAIPHR